MNKLLINYTVFALGCALVIAGFVTATSYVQLAAFILLYPALIFLGAKALPLRRKVLVFDAPVQTQAVEEKIVKRESIGIADLDKRVFLKLIGGAGIFLFLFSLLNKKGEGVFYKGLPASLTGQTGTDASKIALEDSAGKVIDPSQSQPLDGYSICEIDNNIVSFYGYINKDGAWVVMRVDTRTASFRYSKGEVDFPTNWNSREKLKYDYFSNVF